MPQALRLALLPLLVLLVTACSNIRSMEIDERLFLRQRAFENALHWGEYEVAASFIRPAEDSAPGPDPADLKDFKVTEMVVRGSRVIEPEKRIEVTSVISYYPESTQRLSTLTYTQIWVYEPERREWYSETPLPALR